MRPPASTPQALEAFLARLYTDAALRRDFLAAPLAVARGAGLDDDQAASLAAIDVQGLTLAADSFAHKRERHRVRRPSWLARWFGRWRGERRDAPKERPMAP